MAVTVLGSINVDLIQQVAHLPRPGETVAAGRTLRLPGGKGANQAVAAARMGAQVAMIGATGADEGGAWMRACLQDAEVDIAGIRILQGHGTGTAYIAVDQAGENQIIVAGGANLALAADDLPPMSGGGILLAQLEVPPATIAAAFADGGATTILNTAPALAEATDLFAAADILVLNQAELATYLGVARIATARDALTARELLTRHDQLAIVTLGAGGAVAVWPDRAFHAPAAQVVPLDTVGAGDCFCGALAALLDEGLPVERALVLANAAAALSTQTRGAIPAMPDRAAVTAFAGAQATEHAPAIKNAAASGAS